MSWTFDHDLDGCEYACLCTQGGHERASGVPCWLESVINSNVAYAYSELVLSGFMRVVTHPRMFERPSSPEAGIAFAQQITMGGHAVCLASGGNHWDLFLQ